MLPLLAPDRARRLQPDFQTRSLLSFDSKIVALEYLVSRLAHRYAVGACAQPAELKYAFGVRIRLPGLAGSNVHRQNGGPVHRPSRPVAHHPFDGPAFLGHHSRTAANTRQDKQAGCRDRLPCGIHGLRESQRPHLPSLSLAAQRFLPIAQSVVFIVRLSGVPWV